MVAVDCRAGGGKKKKKKREEERTLVRILRTLYVHFVHVFSV